MDFHVEQTTEIRKGYKILDGQLQAMLHKHDQHWHDTPTHGKFWKRHRISDKSVRHLV